MTGKRKIFNRFLLLKEKLLGWFQGKLCRFLSASKIEKMTTTVSPLLPGNSATAAGNETTRQLNTCRCATNTSILKISTVLAKLEATAEFKPNYFIIKHARIDTSFQLESNRPRSLRDRYALKNIRLAILV